MIESKEEALRKLQELHNKLQVTHQELQENFDKVRVMRILHQPRTQGTFRNESTLVDRGHVVSLYCPDFGQ